MAVKGPWAKRIHELIKQAKNKDVQRYAEFSYIIYNSIFSIGCQQIP